MALYNAVCCDSTRMNNMGIEHLQQGRLHEAYTVLSLASTLNQEEAYDSPFEDSVLYRNQWVDVSHIIDAVVAAASSLSSQNQPGIKLATYPCCLRIEKQEPIRKESHLPDKLREQSVFTSRLDWIIEFNLALVCHILGTLHCNVDLFKEAHRLYDQVGKDMLEWHDYSATLDIALLLIAAYNNQACIYHRMGADEIASFYMDRVSSIYLDCSKLRANPLCLTFEVNYPIFWNRDCAGAA
eukprot:scaffold733_cov97-Cylindrotheca_fusiformis.AAC.4